MNCSIIFVKFNVPGDGNDFITPHFDIVFDKERFWPKLRKGVVLVRARLILMEDLPGIDGKVLDIGTVLKTYQFEVSFNKPEKAGPEIDIRYVQFDDRDHRRARISDKGNAVEINTNHPEYKACSTPIAKGDYITRVALRYAIIIYASQGALDNELIPAGTTVSNFDYYRNLEEKIEEIWYQQCLRM